MKSVSFIERCQSDVIEQILRHCGLWQGPLLTRAGARAPTQPPAQVSPPSDLEFVPDPAFEQSECLESDDREFAEATGEFQLVLDPEFL